MKYCKKCLFPDSKPDIYFDEKGICDACRSAERKHLKENQIDWGARDEEFKKIVEKLRSKKGWYDCIVPVSGGKDSSFQVHAMKNVYNLNPLAITFDQFDQSPTGLHNLEALKSIGVDHVHFTLNPKVVKRLVKKGFEIVGDPYWVNHVGMFTVPAHFAVDMEIPLIIWGENPQLEYGGPAASRENRILDRAWRQEFGLMRGYREEDMVDEEISEGDLRILHYPSDEEVKRVGVMGLFYGSFHKWDSEENMNVAKKYGWKALPEAWPGSWLDWENCDMKFLDVREHLKWIKFGYGRTTDQVNIMIRSGRISREKGLKIVQERDGVFSAEHKKEFCDYINISEKEFDRIRDTFVNTDILRKNKKNEWELKEPIT